MKRKSSSKNRQRSAPTGAGATAGQQLPLSSHTQDHLDDAGKKKRRKKSKNNHDDDNSTAANQQAACCSHPIPGGSGMKRKRTNKRQHQCQGSQVRLYHYHCYLRYQNIITTTFFYYISITYGAARAMVLIHSFIHSSIHSFVI